MRRRITALPALLLSLAVAGCQLPLPGLPGAKHPSASATSPTPDPPNLVVGPTTNATPLKLRIGEPASFRYGGVTITVTPKNLVRIGGAPAGLAGDPKSDCGQWWRTDEDVVIDVTPNPAWRGWFMDFNGLIGLYSEKHRDNGDYTDGTGHPGSREPHDLPVSILEAGGDEWDGHSAFHKELHGPEFLNACAYVREPGPDGKNHTELEPDPRPLIGLLWGMKWIDTMRFGPYGYDGPNIALWLA